MTLSSATNFDEYFICYILILSVVKKIKNMSKILGIDLGTTSVKAVILDPYTNKVDYEATAATEAGIQLPDPLKNEQDVNKIFCTLDKVLESFPQQLLQNVGYIGISGQMHGVVLWAFDAWTTKEKEISINKNAVSSLITWQDARCTPEFLTTLPTSDYHLGVHTGFGIPTLYWLKQFEPEQLRRYQYSGTIHDFLVAVLTNNTTKPVMTPQNGASWAYFNSFTRNWALSDLRDFSVDLLPEIVEAGTIAGTLSTSWHGIPAGCKIGAAIGDAQASIYSTLSDKSEGSAFLNISTSAQLAFIISNEEFPSKFESLKATRSGTEIMEYFDGHYVMVAAALNGGNCLATFVQTIQNWVQDLGLQIEKETIWSKILTNTTNDTDLIVSPTLLGERNDPLKKASVSNIHSGNLGLHQLTHSICRGIITNIEGLLPQQVLLQNGIHTIYGTGTALHKNKILQKQLEQVFNKIKVEMCSCVDSAIGAALIGKRWIEN